jgi:hypothetical protein
MPLKKGDGNGTESKATINQTMGGIASNGNGESNSRQQSTKGLGRHGSMERQSTMVTIFVEISA